MNSKFTSLVKSACEDALMARGFKRLRRHEVALELSSDFLGWVGLNSGNHKTHLRINPFVGVHCVPLMRLVADLEGEKYQVGSIATYAVHLGQLCPSVQVFEFGAESDLQNEAARLAATVHDFGVPYMHSIADLDTLVPMLKERTKMLGGYPERYAAALRLADKEEEARAFVLACRQQYASKEEAVRASFDRFAVPFLARPH